MNESRIKKVACPSCGAPLLFGAGEITTRCQFCHAVVERPLGADRPAVVKPGPDAPRPIRQSAGSPPADSIRTFSTIALGLGALVAAGIVVMAVALGEGGGLSGSRLILNGPIAALPVDRTEGPDFIALAYDISSGTNLYLRVDPVAGKVLWRGKEFEDSSDVRELAVGDARFFAVEGSELHAYLSADGAEIWQAKLSDELGYCEGCLSAEGDRVIALTQDYVIEAFDTGTGASAWKRRMDGYTSGYTILDGGLWVIDKLDGRQNLLHLSLSDGSILRRIAPVCRRTDGNGASEMSSSSRFVFDMESSARSSSRPVYILYGWLPGCVERWDVPSDSPAWQTIADDGYSPSSDFAALLTSEELFFSDGDTLWSASTSDGQIRVLSEGGDYELVPMAFERDVLILRTKRTRGTAQFGLRGFDPAAGKILWDHPIENGSPYDPPEAAFRHVDEDEAIWTWRLSGGLLHLFTFQANPNQLRFSTLDPKTGTFAEREPLAFDFVSDSYFGPQIVFRDDPVLWIVVDSKLLAVDTAAALVKYQFP